MQRMQQRMPRASRTSWSRTSLVCTVPFEHDSALLDQMQADFASHHCQACRLWCRLQCGVLQDRVQIRSMDDLEAVQGVLATMLCMAILQGSAPGRSGLQT